MIFKVNTMYYLFFVLASVFFMVPGIYYFYMKKISERDWNIQNYDKNILPQISIIVPTYNEEKIINYKLKNILVQNYPLEKIQIIVIDSKSEDGTLKNIENFIEQNSHLNIMLIQESERKGKSTALNNALQYVENELIIISDVDCFLPKNIILNSLPYIMDPSIAAVAAEETIINSEQSWITRAEKKYREKMRTMRLGESKLYSTIRFEGGFALYKKSLLNKFDTLTGADDSGTTYNLIQESKKTIFVPDIHFYTYFPSTLKGKISIKVRRGNQLVLIWLEILKSLLRGNLKLPKRIAIPNIFLHVINPIIFVILIFLSLQLIYKHPIVLATFFLLVIPTIRLYSIEIILNYSILLISIIGVISGRKYHLWSIVDEPRNLVNEIDLNRLNLL